MCQPLIWDETTDVSYAASSGKNGGVGDVDGRNLTIRTLFLLDEDQNC